MKKIVLTGTLTLLLMIGMGSIANATRTTDDDTFLAPHSNQGRNDEHRSGSHAGGNDRPVSVPEPGTLILLGSGLAGLALLGRKWKNRP